MAEFVKLAKASEIPPGKVHVYEVDGRRIAVCNVDGGFYAIDDVCTHDGGALDQGQLEGDQIECPRHGARFDVRTGRALTLPAVLPVQSYPVRVEGDEIRVQVDENREPRTENRSESGSGSRKMRTRTFARWVEPYAAQLRENRAQVIAFARSLPAEAWERPSPLPGWTYKDLLAHIGRGNDQLFQQLLRTVVAGKPIDTKMFAVDTDQANAQGVGERRDRTAEELIAELEEESEEIQELLSQLTDEHEHLRQDDPPFHFKGYLRFVVREESHDREHLAQLRTALEAE